MLEFYETLNFIFLFGLFFSVVVVIIVPGVAVFFSALGYALVTTAQLLTKAYRRLTFSSRIRFLG